VIAIVKMVAPATAVADDYERYNITSVNERAAQALVQRQHRWSRVLADAREFSLDRDGEQRQACLAMDSDAE